MANSQSQNTVLSTDPQPLSYDPATSGPGQTYLSPLNKNNVVPKTPDQPTPFANFIGKTVNTIGNFFHPDLYKDQPSTQVSKPVSVVSSNTVQPAITKAQGIVANPPKPPLYNTDGTATAYGKTQGIVDTPPVVSGTSVTTPPPAPLPDPTQKATDAIIHQGQTQYYNTTTGQPEWLTTSQTPPAGYSAQDPKTRSDVVDTADSQSGDSVIIKKFSDGTYGRFNTQTGDYSAATAGDFTAANRVGDANKALDNLKNGILTPEQQAQIEDIKATFQASIDKQKVDNANAEGGQTIAQNMYGMGNTLTGKGAITQVINEGAKAIAALQSQMSSAITQMKASLEKQDSDLLQSALGQYQDAQKGIQSNIDKTKALVMAQQTKVENENMSINVAMAKKYDDVDPVKYPGGILPDMTAQERQDALATSPTYKEATALKQSLTDDENGWYADLESTGAAKDLSLPGGRSAAGIQMNIPIIKQMIAKAQAAGISGTEFGQALTNSVVAGAVLNKISQKGDQLQVNEDKVTKDINQLDGLANQVNTKEFQSNVPLLQKFLQGVDVHLTGSQAYVNFIGLLKTTMTAYASVVNGQTGSAGTSVSINDEIQKILPPGASPQMAVDYLKNVAIPEMQHTTDSFKDTEKSLSDQIGASVGNKTYGSQSSNLSTSPSSSSSGSTSGSGGFASSW